MKIEHIAIWTRDLEKMKSFYTRYFGAEAGDKYSNPKNNFSSYFLSFPEGSRLELMQMPGVSESTRAPGAQEMGLIHFAISVGTQATVDELTEQIRKDGYLIAGEPRWTGDGYYESVVLDPENNLVEITQ